jgi:hypothetical protein
VNGIPILSNRTIEQEVRLRANETSILSGLIETSALRSVNGWPGLSFLGPLTGDHDKQETDTELVIAITPRQLRLTPHQDHSFYAGRGVGTAAPPEPVAPGLPQPAGVPVPGAAPGVPRPGVVPPGAIQPGIAPPGALVPGAPPIQTPGPTTGNTAPQPPTVIAPGNGEPNAPPPAQPNGPPPSER